MNVEIPDKGRSLTAELSLRASRGDTVIGLSTGSLILTLPINPQTEAQVLGARDPKALLHLIFANLLNLLDADSDDGSLSRSSIQNFINAMDLLCQSAPVSPRLPLVPPGPIEGE